MLNSTYKIGVLKTRKKNIKLEVHDVYQSPRTHNQSAEICSPAVSASANALYYSLRYVPSDACAKPCSEMDIRTILVGTTPSDSSGVVKMTFSKKIPVSREVLSTSPLSLVAEIGGLLGLTLGVSMINLESVAAFAWTLFRDNAKCYKKL